MDGTSAGTATVSGTFTTHSTTHGTLRLGPLSCRTAEAFGAALRRALMGSVEGDAVSAVRIDGAAHEFTLLDGVTEDLVAIVENLKRLRPRLARGTRHVVTLTGTGPGALTAADLAHDPAVIVADPDQPIATLNTGARLAMAVEIRRGIGHHRAATDATPRPGWIEIDADFSPIDRVAIDVEQDGDAATLVLAITTRGTIAPADAVERAVAALDRHADAVGPIEPLCGRVIEAVRNPVDDPVAPAAPPTPGARHLCTTPADVPVPDLAGLQKRSYERFVQLSCARDRRARQGLEALLDDAFPIDIADGGRLEYAGYDIGPCTMPPDQCVRFGTTYAGPLRLHLRRAGATDTFALDVCAFPLMTDRATFVIAGIEKVVVGELEVAGDATRNDLRQRRLCGVGDQLHRVLADALADDVRAALSAPASHLRLDRVAGALRRFFTADRRVRRAETANPLTLLSQVRAVVQTGLDRRAGYEARDVHPAHFGRLCLLETPEGERIGANLSTAILASVDDQGRLTTPYRRTDRGEVEHLAPDAERDATIGDLAGQDAYRKRYADKTLALRAGDVVRVDPRDVSHVPVHPQQALGASGALIPLIAHDDANRALMGVNMQKQAVPLLEPEAPIVRTGLETRVAADAGATVVARADGVVARAAADRIVINADDGSRQTCALAGFAGSSHGTCLRERAQVRPGQAVARGQVIADGPAVDHGTLALGKTVLVGYLSYEGYNFEDAIVVSDRLIGDEVFTSVTVHEFVTTVRHSDADTVRIGPDALDAPDRGRLSPEGLVREGQVVEGGDVLVAKAVVDTQTDGPRTPRDASLRMPVGHRGTVVRVEHYAADRGDPLAPEVGERVRVTIAVRRPLAVGDKLCNRHGAKGTVARVVPQHDMPVLPDGRPLDVILSPLGVPSRMNIGQLLETHLGLAAQQLGCTVTAPGFNGVSVEDIDALLVEAGLPASGMLRLRDGRTGRRFDHESTVGYLYMMKLVHMSADRVQARCTGPYADQTRQPVGGRRHGGGQHIGIMETWALQAHGAAHTLQEMLTVKSDDEACRASAYEALVAGGEWPGAGVPHSVKRLVSQLRGLGLDLCLTGDHGQAVDVFAPGASVDAAQAATIAYASPDTIRTWSAGPLCADDPDATFRDLFGHDQGLAIRHIELAVPVRHPWADLVGRAGDRLPPIVAVPVLPASLRGGRRLDRLYLAVRSANALAEPAGADAQSVAALQHAVDDLFAALTRLLYGKRGWITAAVSGKTVDYSARSVASPGPNLRYDQCGLPRTIAAALFEPIVVGDLMRSGLAPSADDARRMLRDATPEALAALDRAVGDRLVLLCRAPTLHRMGIQAFRAHVTDENVIRVHPLTLRAFNADFDGDELDVYLPLSDAAQAEAQHRMRSIHCQLGPANGSYLNTPSQDMIFGCYYATVADPATGAQAHPFLTPDAVRTAFQRGEVGVHDPIVLASGPGARRTTVGRAMFNQFLPRGTAWIDQPVTHVVLQRLFADCRRRRGPDASARLGDAVMRFGFHHATRSGLSLGKDVLVPCPGTDARLGDAWHHVDTLCADRAEASDDDTRYWDVLDHWVRVVDELTETALAELARDRAGLNPLHMMIASGARGSRIQARQLVAMRGLMTMPDGHVIRTPLTTTFLRGHSPIEYLVSTFGARKGLADTALKTADAGFLFKRIVSTVQDVVVSEPDCGTADGVAKRALAVDGRELLSLAKRITGRTAADDVALPDRAEPIVRRGRPITQDAAAAIAAAGTRTVSVRSPLTCRSTGGVCAACYGQDLGTGEPVVLGTAAGIVAGQSIGEPMTQLTMRTFVLAVPARPAPPGRQPVRTIVGGMPRLDQLLEAGGRVGPSEMRRQLRQMLRDQGMPAVAEHLLTEIHRVYLAQGVTVDDRHYALVLREMLSRLRVTDPGGTVLDVDQIVSVGELASANADASGRPAAAEPTVVGVTEAAVATTDFIAAGASHHGVVSLARAAASARRIDLRGVRACTALGKLIPC